ncbi:MAG: ABC transporter ATP-binding protein, partial [Ruminococcus sp.]|nr:ABC transporter ATP-binding protein [Ruminococcus sp.]
MFNKVKPYMGGYIRYTYAALGVMLAGLIASAMPFFMVYRIIRPLIEEKNLSAGYYAVHIAIIFACELVYSNLYVLGLKYSHISAYNTLKNIRISLQGKLERQPLGTIQDMGNGRIKKLFTDDIDQVELLLAHAIPEGIANLSMALIALICMFFADWKLALLSLASLPIGLFAMGMMFKAGMERM